MIFLDTSAIYALADRSDANHEEASRRFGVVLERGTPLITHNYVVIESVALLQHRLGLTSARRFLDSLRAFRVEWVTETIHSEAAMRWAIGKRNLSLVDQVSFVIMNRHGIEEAFAFDPDFRRAGFRVFRA